MVEEFKPDGIYRAVPFAGGHVGYVAQAYIAFRGVVNCATYSEPGMKADGHMRTNVVVFSVLWAAQKKCRQLNNVLADPED